MSAHGNSSSRTAITSPQIPRAAAKHADAKRAESGTRRAQGATFRPPPPDLDLCPTAVELAWLEVLIEDLEAMLSESALERLRERLLQGSYAAALEELDTHCHDAPRNRSLSECATELRGVAKSILEARLGPSTRKFLACEHEGQLSPGMRAIVDVAREPTSRAQLMRAAGTDEVAALERIVRLLQRGFLLAGPLPTMPPKIERVSG